MKIVYLIPDLGITIDGHKGASSHIRGFVSALKLLGQDIKILTTQPVTPGTLDVPIEVIPSPKFIQGLYQEENPRAYRALRHVFYNGAIEKSLEKVIAEFSPDFVYERYSPFSAAGSICCQQHGVPHILEVNAPLAEQGKQYRNQALQEASELLEKTAYRETSLIVTLTHELRDWLLEQGIDPKKVKVRPSGVDVVQFSPEGLNYTESYQGKIVLGFVGSLKGWHDIEIIAKAFRQLVIDPKYHLMIVGDGPMRTIIQDLVNEYPDRVTFTGAISQDEVPKYIRTMDIALAPYPNLDLFYFSPLKVYEYMAAGRAIIASGIGQLNELITHGKNGMIVPPGDCDELVKAIKELAENPELRLPMDRL